jgi:hypothetical protein
MDSSAIARQFARLLWLLVHDAANVDDQKLALRALLAACRTSSATLTLEHWRVLADGVALPDNEMDLQTLAAQMTGHTLKALRLSAGAVGAQVLSVARALASEPRPGNRGRAVTDALAKFDAPTVSIDVDAVATPEPPPPAPAPEVKPQRPPMRPSGSYLAFAAVAAPKGSVREMLAELNKAETPEEATLHMEGILILVDRAAEEGKADLVADTLSALVSGEESCRDERIKRAYVMGLRQLKKPRLMKMIARLLSQRSHNIEQILSLLGRWGQDGTDALIDELTVAETLAERRRLFDALVTLRAATSSLLHMLQDKRWFVLRNAAELLGELPSPEAEAPLAKLLKHADERVRRAAAVSLGKIGTGNAFAALRAALRDESTELRLVAATALGAWKRATSSHSLVVALEGEEDGDVQLQIITTLGRVGTPDAVERLALLAEPGGTLFNRKAAAMRLAAVEALGEAGTPAAIEALGALRDDKDPEVRDAARRLVKAAKSPTRASPS